MMRVTVEAAVFREGKSPDEAPKAYGKRSVILMKVGWPDRAQAGSA